MVGGARFRRAADRRRPPRSSTPRKSNDEYEFRRRLRRSFALNARLGVCTKPATREDHGVIAAGTAGQRSLDR